MYDLDDLAVLWKLAITAILSILNENASPMAHFWIPDPPTSSDRTRDGTRRGWAAMPIATNPVDLAAVLARASAMAPAGLAPASCLLFSAASE